MDNDTDFFSIPQSQHFRSRLDETLRTLVTNQVSLPWKEIGSRSGNKAPLAVLMEAASELASINAQSLFRKNDRADNTLTSIWLSYVLTQSRISLLESNNTKFKGLNQESLRYIGSLSREPNNVHKLPSILEKQFGIILVIERAFKGMNLDGVVTKTDNGVPIIGLSVRYSRYDNFWFTLMHELSHVLLHYDSLDEPICDDLDSTDELADVETEANRFAADSLIPRRLWMKASVRRSLNKTDLLTLAAEAEIHPAIAAGIIRKSTGNYRLFNDIINNINIRELLGVKA